jgi:glycosyltransferase involved in cell wall biosynthesis
MTPSSSDKTLSRFRLAIFISSFRGGGAQGAMVQLANKLASQDLAVEIIVLQNSGPWRDKVEPSVAVIDLGVSRAAFSIPSLTGYLKRRRPDVLLSNVSHLNIVAVAAHRLAGEKSQLMLLEHNDLRQRLERVSPFERLYLPFLMRITYPHADHVLAVSRGVAESVAETLAIDPDTIHIFPNGIDIQHIYEQARDDVEHPWLRERDVPVVLAVGRLVLQKGYSDLLHAFALLTERIQARLIILGEGPLRKELEAITFKLKINDIVDLPGFQPNPFAFIGRANLFVLSSLYEGFGIVLLEAMACGTPVVSTDCQSGPREVLADGEAGLLVPVGDPHALAASMWRVLTDSSLAKRLKQAGKEQAEIFSIDNIADRFLGLVSEVGMDSE